MSTLRACVLKAADAVEASNEALGALDGVAGDGDHGITMTIGARSVRRRLAAMPEADGVALLTEVMLALSAIGGAIGPIYVAGLTRVIAELKAAGTDPPLTTPLLIRCAEGAENGVAALGKASPGDKTILDAIHPVVEALAAAETSALDFPTAIALAVVAARSGAESTAGMIATIGRASRLGERGRGSADPGATSFAIIIEALADGYFEAGRSRTSAEQRR